MREFTQSTKLASVRYDVRGPILREAQHLEAEGHEIIKLNIGNTAPFGLHAPPTLLADMARSLPESDGYSDSRGIVPAREAVADHYGDRGFPALSAEDVWIGNGVSELISMTLQAFVDAGDEVLVP
ncbi:aminotransferase class I/II-fold pyridoxal phosphate-dependent enzyme, partial [Streptomyces sp. DH37]